MKSPIACTVLIIALCLVHLCVSQTVVTVTPPPPTPPIEIDPVVTGWTCAYSNINEEVTCTNSADSLTFSCSQGICTGFTNNSQIAIVCERFFPTTAWCCPFPKNNIPSAFPVTAIDKNCRRFDLPPEAVFSNALAYTPSVACTRTSDGSVIMCCSAGGTIVVGASGTCLAYSCKNGTTCTGTIETCSIIGGAVTCCNAGSTIAPGSCDVYVPDPLSNSVAKTSLAAYTCKRIDRSIVQCCPHSIIDNSLDIGSASNLCIEHRCSDCDLKLNFSDPTVASASFSCELVGVAGAIVSSQCCADIDGIQRCCIFHPCVIDPTPVSQYTCVDNLVLGTRTCCYPTATALKCRTYYPTQCDIYSFGIDPNCAPNPPVDDCRFTPAGTNDVALLTCCIDLPDPASAVTGIGTPICETAVCVYNNADQTLICDFVGPDLSTVVYNFTNVNNPGDYNTDDIAIDYCVGTSNGFVCSPVRCDGDVFARTPPNTDCPQLTCTITATSSTSKDLHCCVTTVKSGTICVDIVADRISPRTLAAVTVDPNTGRSVQKLTLNTVDVTRDGSDIIYEFGSGFTEVIYVDRTNANNYLVDFIIQPIRTEHVDINGNIYDIFIHEWSNGVTTIEDIVVGGVNVRKFIEYTLNHSNSQIRIAIVKQVFENIAAAAIDTVGTTESAKHTYIIEHPFPYTYNVSVDLIIRFCVHIYRVDSGAAASQIVVDTTTGTVTVTGPNGKSYGALSFTNIALLYTGFTNHAVIDVEISTVTDLPNGKEICFDFGRKYYPYVDIRSKIHWDPLAGVQDPGTGTSGSGSTVTSSGMNLQPNWIF